MLTSTFKTDNIEPETATALFDVYAIDDQCKPTYESGSDFELDFIAMPDRNGHIYRDIISPAAFADIAGTQNIINEIIYA